MILRNVLANTFGRVWTALMALAFVPLYVQYLGIEAYGLIGLFAVMTAWLALLDIGMTPMMNREMARFTAGAHSPESIRTLLRTLEVLCIGLALLAALAVWALSGFLASRWLRPQALPPQVVTEAIAVMALVIGLRFCEGIFRGALQGLQRQVWYNAANATLSTLRHGGAVLVLAWLAPSLRAFFLWQAAVSLASIAVLAFGVYRVLPSARAQFSLASLRTVWKFAGGMLAISALAVLLTQVDKILLSRLLPLDAFGYYTFAASVAAALLLIPGPIVLAVYPRLVEMAMHDDPLRLSALYHETAQAITVLMAPALLLLHVFAPEVVYVWSGDWQLAQNAAPVLSILALGTFLNGVMTLPYQCQLAYGWTTLAVRVNTVAVVLLVPAIGWAVVHHGAVGAAWVWVVLNSGYVLISMQLMHRRILRTEKWRWYVADLLLPLAAAGTIVAIAAQVQPGADAGRGPWLGFLAATGVLSLAAAALAADRVRHRVLGRA